ncbi:MAG: type IV toxin-antitoxin system AbiEi family antitoxin, partial [Fusobacteriaceae bacterium]|nr:type IV toxin-antitoxin system AbiEi family antitoxin [Fusobacteriaceae bacterium]
MDPANNVRDWITSLPKKGRIAFDLQELKSHFLHMPQKTIDSVIYRLKKNNRLYSARQGFYVIIPDEYALRGFVPPIEYIDRLMNSLGRTYYVALLSAAAIYGSAHQQPQVLQVIADSNQLKSRIKNESSIRFFAKHNIPAKYIVEKAAGRDKICISTPEFTSLDLVLYEDRIGGLERVAEVLAELSETIDYSKADAEFWRSFPSPVIQR